MKSYTRLNNVIGWLSFFVAAFTYLITIEPTTSLWDCGEFIASAFKLQVGHPPGAPLFMIMARFFSLFTSDVAQVAMMVNAMSALASAFTILFLFWTISHLAKKMVIKNPETDYTTVNYFKIFGAALVGALAYTFSDTFWFSAVEGEVYASSSLFTAVVFWAILKWENVAHEKFSNRWIILIAYLVGLSIGVHLLNLLAIPAIVFVYYFRTYKPTRNGVIAAAAISIVLLGAIMYGIIPGIVKMASQFELFFVNSMGLPFKSGVLVYAVLLIATLVSGIYFTQKLSANKVLISVLFTIAFVLMGIPLIADSYFLAVLIAAGVFLLVYYAGWNQHAILNNILVSFAVIILGYSSFSMIVIRSLANPPMDENNPETVFSLLSYLNREQYGDRPLFFGQYYSAPVTDVVETKPTYTQIGDRYEITNRKSEYIYDENFTTIFPRMYSSSDDHIEVYKQYAKIKGTQVRAKNGERLVKPTFSENMRFFIRYQVGHMYFRYFLWNFVGRQNDIQANGGITKGNWISGIEFWDEMRLGPQDKLPPSLKNHPARNAYFALPLIFGLLGLAFHYKKDKANFWVVMLLFVLTGLAIVFYLNQTPNQPRERDYAYAGSFYAFAIWIGLGVMAIIEWLGKLNNKVVPVSAVIVGSLFLVPGIMASENWDDHDRSGRYTARAIAKNYLESCEPNAILFTNGDNDTFPLWYAQDVEGIRTDVRVVNLMLLNTDWYIDQMKRKAYESEPVPFSLTQEKYMQGTRDVVYIQERVKKFTDIEDIMNFVASDKDQTKLALQNGKKIDFIPTKNFRMKIPVEKVLANGTVAPEDSAKIEPVIEWTLNRGHLTKGDLMVLDLLATNNWERPVYFVSLGHSGTLGLDRYTRLEGFAYRLVPYKSEGSDFFSYGDVNTEKMYDNIMNKFEYGRMNAEDVYLDHFHVRTFSVLRFRNNFARLANALYEEGQKEKAIAVLDKAVELTPNEKIPYDFFMVQIIDAYLKMDENEKAQALIDEFSTILDENIAYYLSVGKKYIPALDQDLRQDLHALQQLVQITQNELPEMHQALNQQFQGYYQQFMQFQDVLR